MYSRTWESLFNPGNAKDFFIDPAERSFFPEQKKFVPANAWWLSEISRLIYVRGKRGTSSEEQVALRSRYLKRAGLEEIWFHNRKHLQCSAIVPTSSKDETFTILVFRGITRESTYIPYIMDFVLSPWSTQGRVHRGFKRIIEKSWNELKPVLDRLPQPLYFTGHSLGGALAVLTATLIEPAAVYTFGAPRMADSDFVVHTQNLSIFRMVNSHDIVASMPPFPIYHHVGETHSFKGAEPLKEKRHWFDPPAFLSDHSPFNYSQQNIEIK